MGHPRYAAPELFWGGLPSVTTDLYASGLVLFEMITGVHALAVASADWRYTHCYVEATALEALVPNAPSSLCALLRCMLSKTKSERPHSADACLQLLRVAQRDVAIAAVNANATTEDAVDSLLRQLGGAGPEEITLVDPPSSHLLHESGEANDTLPSPPPSSGSWSLP
jgi:serine/threonine protein kinase